MKQVIALLLLLFVLSSLVTAQDQLEERVGAERPSSARITLVIDVSGSMSGPKLVDAVNTATSLAIQPTDDLEVAIIVFSSEARRLLDPVTGNTWFRLPSEPIAAALRASLFSLSADGNTNPADALREAFSEETQSVVLITDGGFNSGSDPAHVVRSCQDDLRRAERPVPAFVILAVQSGSKPNTNLEELAAQTGGQLWTTEAVAATTGPGP